MIFTKALLSLGESYLQEETSKGESMKKLKLDKVQTAKVLSTIFSVLGIVGTIGSIFVEDTCTRAAIDEAVDERLKKRGL